MADKYKWGTVEVLPDGHRLFPDDFETTHIAIADDSGREPQDTLDGILWLDFEWNLIISSPDMVYLIPVMDDSGDRHSTISNMPTLLKLAAMLEWPIEDQVTGTIYSVTKESK